MQNTARKNLQKLHNDPGRYRQLCSYMLQMLACKHTCDVSSVTLELDGKIAVIAARGLPRGIVGTSRKGGVSRRVIDNNLARPLELLGMVDDEEAPRANRPRHAVLIPLRIGNRTVGTLNISRKTGSLRQDTIAAAHGIAELLSRTMLLRQYLDYIEKLGYDRERCLLSYAELIGCKERADLHRPIGEAARVCNVILDQERIDLATRVLDFADKLSVKASRTLGKLGFHVTSCICEDLGLPDIAVNAVRFVGWIDAAIDRDFTTAIGA